MTKTSVAIIGYGYVGKAYNKMFPEALIYDPYYEKSATKEEINAKCGLAIVCVPTNLLSNGSLDTSVVEESVRWLETPLILIKSALMPGTVDQLVEQYEKKIAVSVELIGEGKYFVPFWKHPHPEDPRYHNCLIIGGETETAQACAEFIWAKASPDIQITMMTATEAEICKLMENCWGALKVTFANEMYELCERYGASYMRVLQGFGSDGRVEKMHMRVVSGKRGWKSKCWDKDIPGLYHAGKHVGYKIQLIKTILETNKHHLRKNDKN